VSFVPPVPPLSDEAIRLEPLDERFAPDFEQLATDPDIVRFTRVPAVLDPGFGAAWVGRCDTAVYSLLRGELR
jgi:hypothetical protein